MVHAEHTIKKLHPSKWMLNNVQNSIKNITMTPIPLIFTMNPIPTPPEFLLPRYQTYIGGAREKLPEKYADGMGIE